MSNSPIKGSLRTSDGDYDDDDTPEPKRMEPKDFAKGPMFPSLLQPAVIYGGVDGTKVSQEERPLKMTAQEFLQKIARPVAGQVVHDGAKPEQKRVSHHKEGPIAKVQNGASKGDPNGTPAKPPGATLAPIRRRQAARTPDNEGPEASRSICPKMGHDAMFDFFAGVYEKLAMGGYCAPSAPDPVVPTAPKPQPPRSPREKALMGYEKGASEILSFLKAAAGVAGANIGALPAQEAGLGTVAMKPAAAAPKGNPAPVAM